MIKEVKYSSFNFSPYVMKTELPEYILQRLKEDGDKANSLSITHWQDNLIINMFIIQKQLNGFTMRYHLSLEHTEKSTVNIINKKVYL